MRYINAIYTTHQGELVSNEFLLPHFLKAVEVAPVSPEHQRKLIDTVRYFLVGERERYVVPGVLDLGSFAKRAAAFEAGAERSLEALAQQITLTTASTDVSFDVIVTTTSSGSLMPGLSYRLAARLGDRVRSDTMMVDLAHVGCTGSMKALKLVSQLDAAAANCLVVSVELPSTLINLSSTEVDVWQGNCTFGDGAAAAWLSDRPPQGDMALAVNQLRYVQHSRTGLDLIRWGYDDYYTFRLGNEETFNRDVRQYITESLQGIDPAALQSPHWAIHPAGIALLLRLSRKLGMPKNALDASMTHYKRFSNASSASILHILRDEAATAADGGIINLLAMGAGFNLIYGHVRKER
jgi:predicted naringenin-chalcone synthase